MNTQEKCQYCDHIGRPDNVRAHIKSVHDKIRPACTACGNDFATKSSLKRHEGKCKKKSEIEQVNEQENNKEQQHDKKHENEQQIENDMEHERHENDGNHGVLGSFSVFKIKTE